MTKDIKECKFLFKLQVFLLREHGTKAKAAEHYKMTTPYLSAILVGDRPPHDDMVNDMGYERLEPVTSVMYRKKDQLMSWGE